MFRKLVVPLVVLGTVAAGMAPAAATGPVRSCADLVRSFDVPDARTRVTSATVVTGAKEFCDVRGTIEPNIRFQLKLSVRGYQGRYLQYGCGGFCGTTGDPAFRTAVVPPR